MVILICAPDCVGVVSKAEQKARLADTWQSTSTRDNNQYRRSLMQNMTESGCTNDPLAICTCHSLFLSFALYIHMHIGIRGLCSQDLKNATVAKAKSAVCDRAAVCAWEKPTYPKGQVGCGWHSTRDDLMCHMREA